MLTLFINAVLLIPITLLPILNPFGNAPIFARFVGNSGRQVENQVARQVAFNCWFMLVGAMFIGSHVLAFFGISLPIVRVGGGLLVAATGWRMISDTTQDSIRSDVADKCGDGCTDDELKVRSFYPISFPLTVGPGTIAASITLGANTPTRLLDWMVSLGSAALGAGVTVAVIYLCYRYANRIVSLLGSLGTVILLRLSAFILLCVGISILWHGVTGLLTEVGLIIG